MKKFKTIILAITLVLFASFACSFAACKNKGGEIVDYSVNFERRYWYTGTSSFAKLKIVSVDEDLYTNWRPYWREQILIECVVEEDYYGTLKSDKVIRIQLLISKTESFSYPESEIRDMFQNNECILVYFSNLYDELIISNLTTKEDCTFTNISDIMSLSYLEIIPINNNKVDLTSLYRWLDKYDESYNPCWLEGYIEDGMLVEEVAKNLRNFAESQK